ncbi:GIY-YIG nuclease family protein [Candidatus Poribacteria bacterium]|nr:GIY-YIG nuclease family protein [Candidatus Poribacteria bacterium]
MSPLRRHTDYTIIPPPNSIRRKKGTDTIGIYRVFHKRTNRSYIGQSIQIEERIRQHFSNSGAFLFRQGSKLAMVKRFD